MITEHLKVPHKLFQGYKTDLEGFPSMFWQKF